MNLKSLRHIAAKSLSLIALSFTLAGSYPAMANDDHHDRGPILQHRNPHFHILPRRPHIFRNVYSEFQARWWQWATSLPADYNPLLDTADGSAGQAGSVWYLGGFFGSSGPIERSLTVPAGKKLFFPVINLGYFLTDATDTVEGSRELIGTIMDHIVTSFAEIDGRPVPHLERFRTESILFNIGPLPENNIIGVAAGSVIPTVDDGIYLLLAPLTPGKHTIHFGGHVLVPADVPGVGGFEFSQDITYHITVESRGR